MPDLFGWYQPPASETFATASNNPSGIDPRLATLSNVMTYQSGKQAGTRLPVYENGDGLGNILDWGQFARLGYDTSSFYSNGSAGAGDDGGQARGITDYAAAERWLQANGLQVAQQPLDDSRFANYLVDVQGNVVGEPFIGDNKDSAFQFGMVAAAAIATGGIANWAAAGGAAGVAPAAEAGIGTLGSLPSVSSQVSALGMGGLTPAAPATFGQTATIGGAAAGAGAAGGGATAAAAVSDPITAYLTTGAVEGSTAGNILTGAGGASGAVGAGTTASTIGSLTSGWDSILKGLSSGSGVRSLFDIASGIYGLNLASNAREASDPFAQYRAGYGQQLQALEANPGSITSRPGWRAGLEGIDRQMAARGYYGSGNMDAARSRYAGDFYGQEVQRLAGLAGANQTPGAGQFQSANLAGNALASIGYGLAPWLSGRPA